MKLSYKRFASLQLGLLMLFSACTSSLEVDPTSVITNNSFWKTENDAVGGLNGMYVKLRSVAQLTLFQLGEGRGETMDWGGIVGTAGYDRFYMNTLDATTAGPNWADYYAIVNAANLLLKYVPGITFKSEATKNNILAQAYTMRAYTYFVMARTWGDLVIRITPTEGYSAETTQKERSPKAEVFKLIREDLDKALTLFPDNNFASGRFYWSKAAAYTLKADVCLWTGKLLNGGKADFTLALEALEEAQKADVTLLPNYPAIFDYANKGNKEVLMAVRFQLLESPNNGYQDMYIPASVIPGTADPAAVSTIGTAGGNIIWTPSALVRGQFTNDDKRKQASFLEIYTKDQGGNTTYFGSIVLKCRGTVDKGVRSFVDDVVLYRYADVLLMKAEAKNALDMNPAAEINEVRQRAYGEEYSNHVFVSGSKVQNDEAILKERLFELAFEGKRWWDLVRFGKAFDLVPSLQGRKGKDYLLLFPISSTTLSLEPKVEQNEGYQ